jgi:hypothetical protein
LELGDHAEVAASPSERPKEVWIFPIVRAQDGSVRDDHREAFNIVAGKTMQSVQPPSSTAQHQSGSTGVRNDPGGKCEANALRGRIYGSEKAAASESCTAIPLVDNHLAHTGEVDDQAVVATAKPGKAVAATPDRCKRSGLGCGSHGKLYVSDIGTARNEPGRASDHAVPNGPGLLKFVVIGTQQGSFEPMPEHGVNLFYRFSHGNRLSNEPAAQ